MVATAAGAQKDCLVRWQVRDQRIPWKNVVHPLYYVPHHFLVHWKPQVSIRRREVRLVAETKFDLCHHVLESLVSFHFVAASCSLPTVV